MHSKLFEDYGIQPVQQETDVLRDSQGLPRVFFRSSGNPLVGLDLTGASQLQQRMIASGEIANAQEMANLIVEARTLGIGEPQM